MHDLAIIGIKLLVGLFLVGLVGSAVVVVISFVEDFAELLKPDKESEARRAAPTA
jgi:hypothetical protein